MHYVKPMSATPAGLYSRFVLVHESANPRFVLPARLSATTQISDNLPVVRDKPAKRALRHTVSTKEPLNFFKQILNGTRAAGRNGPLALRWNGFLPERAMKAEDDPVRDGFTDCGLDCIGKHRWCGHCDCSLSDSHVSVGTAPSVADSILWASSNEGRRAPEATRETVATVVFTRVAKSACRMSRLFKYCFSAVMVPELTDYVILRKTQFTRNGMDVNFVRPNAL